MAILLAILSVLPPLLVGFLLVALFWPSPPRPGSLLVSRIVLAVGAAVGLSSCSSYLFLVLFGYSRGLPALTESLFHLLLAVALLFMLRRRRRKEGALSGNAPGVQAGDERGVQHERPAPQAGLWLLAACAVLLFAYLIWMRPHGRTDAWSIWNLHARLVFRSAEKWESVFAQLPGSSYRNHPLLLPAAVARAWSAAGRELMLVPWTIAFIFTFGTVALVVSSLRSLRGWSMGMLAGFVLLGTVNLVRYGSALCADVPLSFYMLSTLLLLVIHDRRPYGSRRLVFLAGLFAGFAAWTKNEGTLFLVAVALGRAPRWRRNPIETTAFAAGLVPALLALVHYKTQFSWTTEILRGLPWPEMAAKLVDPDRWLTVIRLVGPQAVRVGNGFPLLLVLYLLLIRPGPTRRPVGGIMPGLVALLIMLGGYMTVYAVTPYDVAWTVASSIERLSLQLWPSAVLLFFLWAPAPEDAMAGEEGTQARTRTPRLYST